MAVKIIIRHDTASNWTSFNPTLSLGEIGVETDTLSLKVGDGSTAWTSLAYTSISPASVNTLINALDTDDIEEGSANLYFTAERAQDAIAAAIAAGTHSNITITYDDATNKFSFVAENGVADSTTDDLTEGTSNLYFTNERAQDAVGNFVGDGLSYNDSTGAISAQLGSGLEIATGAIVVDTDVIANKTYVGNEISAHAIVTTDVHGVEGDVVGTTDLQTLSNKTLGSVLNANSNKITNLASPVDSNDAANKTYVDSAVAGIVDSAPTALNTLNELAAALGDDASFSTTIATSIGEKVAKSGDTMTGALTLSGDPVNVLHAAPKQYVDSEVTAHDRTTNVHGISDTTNLAYIDDVTGAVGDHSTATTGIHGISDTADLAYKNSPTFTGNVSLPSSTTIGLVTASEIALLSGLTATSTELNTLDGITASTAELNTLDGITASVAELNILNGVTATASEINVLDGITATTSELNILSGVTATAAELNILDGVTATAAELNILDGVTATFAEINILDGVTATASEINVLDGITATTSELNILSGVTATAAELNILDGVTATAAELNILDGVTATFAEINILDGVTADALELNILDGATITTTELNTLSGITASSAELNILDGVTASTAELNKLDGLTASTAELSILSGATLSTAELNLLDGVTATTTELNYVDGVTSAIQTQLDSKAPTSNPTFTGTVSGITKSMVGLGSVDNTADADKPVSTATQTALDLKANLDGPSFTGTVVLPNTTSIGDVSATEIGYVNGVTSGIQTQLDAKAALAGAVFTGSVEIPGLTITGNLVVQGTTTTVSAADLKLRDNMIYLNQAGLSTITNAVGDGTSVVYTTSAAHGYEAGDYVTVTGVTPSSFNISGDGLEITAVTTTTFTVTSTVTDTYTSGGSARGKVHFNPDLGWAAGRYDTVNGVGYAHAGMFRDATDGVFKIFDGYIPEPDDAIFINTAHSSFALAPISVAGLTATSATIGDVSNTELQYLNGVTSAVQTQIDAKAPTADPTFTGTVTVGASGVAFTDGAQTKQGVPSITAISQKTASYTLSDLAERDTIIEIDSISSTTLTIPADSATNYPVGTTLDIIQTNTGQITIAGDAGVTVNATPGLKLRARWSSATLLKRASNTWLVYGDLTA